MLGVGTGEALLSPETAGVSESTSGVFFCTESSGSSWIFSNSERFSVSLVFDFASSVEGFSFFEGAAVMGSDDDDDEDDGCVTVLVREMSFI